MVQAVKSGVMATAVLLFSLSGCVLGSGGARGDGVGLVRDRAERVRVEVHNGNWSDLDVWVIAQNGGRHHLGHVNTGQTRRFRFDLERLGATRELRLLADQTGGDGILSPSVFLAAGDVARWSVAFHPSNSRLSVERAD